MLTPMQMFYEYNIHLREIKEEILPKELVVVYQLLYLYYLVKKTVIILSQI